MQKKFEKITNNAATKTKFKKIILCQPLYGMRAIEKKSRDSSLFTNCVNICAIVKKFCECERLKIIIIIIIIITLVSQLLLLL